MLNIKTSINLVDYRKTLQKFLPGIMEKCRESQQGSAASRFLQKLDDEDINKIYKIIYGLPDDLYNNLICIITRLFYNEIAENINSALQDQGYGSSISIGGIVAGNGPGGSLVLYFNNIDADFNNLLYLSSEKISNGILSWILKLVSPAISGKDPCKQEKKVLSLLQNSFVKKKLENMAEKSLLKNGIIIKLDGIEFSQSGSNPIKLEKLSKIEKSFLDILVSIIKTAE
ncbi:MAG: hypothetical protein HFH68_14775 [Lachnospiraceae bacterium]|nr:hypothetical protein [Lachnospiraceae bacterium]